MIFCIDGMCGYELKDTTTEQWTDAIDRGGLWHVNDNTYYCFYVMEEEIRCHLVVSKITQMNDTTRSQIMDALVFNETLRHQWTVASTVSIDDEHSLKLFKLVLELYLTIRGFAFIKSCLELYKQSSKRQIAKSKGIRKELFVSSTK